MPRPRAPVVAISRWAGALGEDVADRVAAWLDYGLFGAAEIDRIAADPALRERLRAGLPADRVGVLEAMLRSARDCAPGAPAALLEVVVALGVRGMAVILGRGAAAILPPDRALRVLVVAPHRLRAERLATAQGIGAAEAVACVQSADQARRAALSERFGIAAEDLTHYDLVLNTEMLNVDAAAALTVDALRRRFPLP